MRKIHNFTEAGVIADDSHIIRTRETLERTIVQRMRDKGYVPMLDLPPVFRMTYIAQKNQYGFTLTLFGVYVGPKKSKQFEGFTGQEFVPR